MGAYVFRSAPNNGHRATTAVCPKSANNRSEVHSCWRDRPFGEIDRSNHQFRPANAISGRRASTCPNGRRHP
jgi:hypothetical protein